MYSYSLRRILFSRRIGVIFLALTVIYFLPSILLGDQLLYESPAAPVWELSYQTSSMMGCSALSCVPIIMIIFILYTHLLSVIINIVHMEAISKLVNK